MYGTLNAKQRRTSCVCQKKVFEKKQRKRAEEELREVATRKAKEEAQLKELEVRRAAELKKAKKLQSYDILLAVKRKEYEQMTTMHAELEQKLHYEKRIVDALQAKDQEAAREVIGLRKVSSIAARAPPVVLNQFMCR
jgi:DNA polymerase II large subunit